MHDPRVDLLQLLAVLEGIHRHPEVIVLVGRESAFLQQPMEGLPDQFVSVVDVVENLSLEDEISAVDANASSCDVLDRRDASGGIGGDDVVADLWLDADEAGDRVLSVKVLELDRQRQIRQAVGVVRQELRFVSQVRLDGLETLADVGRQPVSTNVIFQS